MKTISLLFIISLFINGVFGDTVTVNEGDSVTLHNPFTYLQRDEMLMWRFNRSRIAVHRPNSNSPYYGYNSPFYNSDPVDYSDVRFTDRLKMNPQTGDLTITNITSELTGDYLLQRRGTNSFPFSSFSVILSPKLKIVKERDSVSIHIDVTEEQRNEKIYWKVKHNNSPVAEIITENRKISTPFIEERFRDRLELDYQKGDLLITHMKNEASGQYEADVTMGDTYTIHKTLSFTDSGVFGDETVRVSVNEGGSVTLHAHLNELKGVHLMVWRFKGDRIARINRSVNSDPVYEPDVRFTDRLKMNPQTGDLTITNITSELTGLYQLKRIGGGYASFSSFSVSLSPKLKKVKERDSVSLHIDVTEEQRNEKIHWKIKHNNSLVAEIITENGKISTSFIEERFRDRLKLDDQTGDLNITLMKNEDSGQYEADVTIGNNTHTIHETLSFTDSGVFGDETDTVSVNDGDSVTLHTHPTELQRVTVLLWRFKDDLIAKINRSVNSDPVYDPDVRFTDRLKMNPQTGDLTITHITSDLTGLYQLDIIREKTETMFQTFSVSLSPKLKKVKERDSVSLHIDVTEEQRNEKIYWKIEHNNSTVAEIITENRKISTPFIEERFKDRLKMDDQTGDLIITHMKNEDSGQYEADVTIGSNTHTIHKTFSFTDSGVFGDTESVNDGDSVTLHNRFPELQTYDEIVWFKGDRIARINRAVNNSDPVYDPDKRFTDRLKMNNQTGDLTITHITSELTGLYHLDIISRQTETMFQSFSVRSSPKVKIVKERDSVSLHIDVTEEQRNEKIHWKIKHNNSLVAEINTENRNISTPFIEERFRDRLKLDDQTGDLIITHMKNEDSGQYEADVTIRSITHTINETFSFTDSGQSSGVIAGISVALLFLVMANGVLIYRHRKMRCQDSNTGEELRETNEPLRNIVGSNGDVPP